MSRPESSPPPPGPAPRQDAWRIIGPGGGGTTYAPTVSPHDPNLVVEHCDMTGAYITEDGGRSWRMLNLRTVVACFAFDPGDPNVIYAGTVALWRSEDRGRTWSMVWPDPARGTVEHMRGDHAVPVLTTDDPGYPGGRRVAIRAVAVDPADPRHVCVAIAPGDGAVAAVYETRDGCARWSPGGDTGAERALLMGFDPVGPGQRDALFVLTDRGLHRRTSGAWRVKPVPSRLAGASGGRADDKSAALVYAVTASGPPGPSAGTEVLVSDCGGDSWRPCAEALRRGLGAAPCAPPPRFGAVACCERRPLTAYVAFEGLRTSDCAGKPCNGIARTTDGGRTWSVVHAESDRPSGNLEASWIEDRAPSGGPNIWFDDPVGLGVAPSDPETCYATDLFRTYRTLDGGRTWQQVNSVRTESGRWTTRGLDVTTCYGVHVDPFDPRRVSISYTDIGLFQSPDGGASWVVATEGIPEKWRNTTYWIVHDPAVRGRLWGAFGLNHDLPRPKMWRRQDPATYEGGVAVSSDGGLHWTPSNAGMPRTAVTHIVLDPTSPPGNRTLFACGFGRGVFRSVDNGLTWALMNAGIEGAQPFAWRLTRAADGTLYLVVARRGETAPLDPSQVGALYRSTDRAEHWDRIELPERVTGPTALTLDPRDESRMYLSAWGLGRPGEDDTGGGVFLSADGGRTWRCIFDRGQHVYDLTVDAAEPDTLYACGFDAAAWRSTDGGEMWERIRGYNFKWGHRVIVDPADRGKVYITTFGGSVWHGPAAGDPHATEDIVGIAAWRPE